MRRLVVASTCVVACAVPTSALAQAPAPAKPIGPSRSSSQFTLRRGEAGGGSIADARTKARAGDCKGALASFDVAIAATVEPTLRRDRGLCHEKLDHPYPAIDDYRAYLVARPEAPDADQIRDRLARLEASVGIGAGPSEDRNESPSEMGFSASGEASADGGGVKVAARSSDSSAAGEPLGPRAGEEARSYDYYREQEKAQEIAADSPLRLGKGFALGAFLGIPRYFFFDSVTSDMGYAVGATLRYSTGRVLSILGEVGYAGIGQVGTSSSAGGPLLFVGLEARLPLNKLASDQILFGAGLDYERQVNSSSNIGINFLGGRGRIGYRHVFGPKFGLEFNFDGGYGAMIPSGVDADTIGGALMGGSIALVVGF